MVQEDSSGVRRSLTSKDASAESLRLSSATTAALVRALLDAWPGFVVLAEDDDAGPKVRYANGKARARFDELSSPGESESDVAKRLLRSEVLRQLSLGVRVAGERNVLLLVDSASPSPHAESVRSPTHSPPWPLSRRQTEVLLHVVAGDTNKVIASRLTLSVSMVEQHLAAIFRKAGVSSRHELIAMHWRLISGGP